MAKKNKTFTKKELIIFVLMISGLSFMAYHKAFDFDFWRDDWGQLWGATYHPKEFITSWAAVRLHPISALEQYILVKIFKLNPLLWQTWGFILKIVDSIFIGLLVLVLTKSKRSALFSGIIFSVFLGGIESVTWVSAHTSSLVIPLLCLGFYFWISSGRKNSFKEYLISLLIFLFTIVSDPARALGIIILASFWDCLVFLQKPTVKSTKNLLRRLSGLLILFMLSRPLLNKANFPPFSEIVSTNFKDLTTRPGLIRNIFYSIGNLLVGWLIKIQDLGGLSNPTRISMRVGLLFLVYFFLQGLYFLIKRREISKAILFLCMWTFLFYIPNWLFDKTLVVGTSHRYVALAAPAVAGIFGILVSSIKNNRIALILLALIVLFNIKSTNRILAQEWNFRSVKVVEALWDKVDNDVPEGEQSSIFMYMGGDYLVGVAMGWSFSIPFGIRRGFTEVDEFPIVTGDIALIKKLVCEGNVERPSVGKWSLQKEKIPLSHLHAWGMVNGELVNVSQQQRELVSKDLPCRTNY